jgi:hypothetical protein
MSQFTSPFVERLVLSPQTTFNAVPQAAGVWTNTGAKVIRMGSGCKIKADPTLIPNPVKTGTRSMQPGIAGRRSRNTWSLPSMPIIPAGVIATVPDQDLLYQSIFGQAAVISSPNATYTFLDGTIVPFILGRFQHLQTTLSQQFAIGCIATDWTININGDIITVSSNGQCYWVLDSENFANEVAAGLCGLTTYPVELVMPTVLGALQQGFVGTATFDGNNVDSVSFPLISADVKGKTGNSYTNDAFGTSYPALPAGGRRMVSTRATFQDSDSSSLSLLKTAAKAKTPLTVTYVVGNVAGSTITMVVKGVQLAVPEYSDEAARVITAFSDSDASASAISTVDEFTLAFS